jgi:hypothetical protein
MSQVSTHINLLPIPHLYYIKMNDISTLKEELHSLYEKKRLLEELVTECVERLESSGVGLEGPLVDSEV